MNLTVLTGPPAAGKTTHALAHARPGDVILDLDRIAAALTTDGTDPHHHPPHITQLAQQARHAALTTALAQPGDHTVWLIDSAPNPVALAHYRDHDARIIALDPGPDVLAARLLERGLDARAAADQWQARSRRTHTGSPLGW